MFDLSTLLRLRRNESQYTLRDLSKASGISHAAIARLENGEIERMVFGQILNLDRILKMDGALVGFAWEVGEYQTGIAMNKYVNKSSKSKIYPTNWNPTEKAFADAFITICRWHQVYGNDTQGWWMEAQRNIAFYKK